MEVTFAQLERKLQRALTDAVTNTVQYTRKQYISSLGAASTQLSSAGAYISRVSNNGSTITGYVTPYATPRPSVMKGYTVHAGTLPEMIEFGWRMNLRVFALSGHPVKVKRPAYPTRGRVQEAMNYELEKQLRSCLSKQGF